MDPVTELVLLIAGLMLLGALGEFIFERTGIPDMIWLVVAGILAGPLLGLIGPARLEPILPFFGAVALVVILMSGGLKLRFAEVRTAAPRAFLLSILGFLLTIVACIVFARVAVALGWLPPMSLAVEIMIGAILGGTSALVIIPAMAKGGVGSHVARLLELESCIADALCVVVTMMMIRLILGGSFDIGASTGDFAQAVGIGAVVGIVGAVAVFPAIRALGPQPHLYTVILAWFFVIYGATEYVGGNGVLSVLIAALIVGNARDILKKPLISESEAEALKGRAAAMMVHDQLSFFVKTFFFFLIGLMFPTGLTMILVGAVFAIVILLFRLPAVLVALHGTGTRFRDATLVAIAIPRGMTAGVLAALPVHYGVPGLQHLVEGVFAAIVSTIVIFTIGFSIVKRMPADGAGDEAGDVSESEPASRGN